MEYFDLLDIMERKADVSTTIAACATIGPASGA